MTRSTTAQARNTRLTNADPSTLPTVPILASAILAITNEVFLCGDTPGQPPQRVEARCDPDKKEDQHQPGMSFEAIVKPVTKQDPDDDRNRQLDAYARVPQPLVDTTGSRTRIRFVGTNETPRKRSEFQPRYGQLPKWAP